MDIIIVRRTHHYLCGLPKADKIGSIRIALKHNIKTCKYIQTMLKFSYPIFVKLI